jgi:hypothetical protein
MRPKPHGRPHEEQSHAAGRQLVQANRKRVGRSDPEHRSERYVTCSAPRSQREARSEKNEAAMDTIPNGNAEQKFQELLTKLMTTPAWSEKQQLELEMARDISVEMLRLAELMRDGSIDLETCLTMLKYAKVLDFVMTTLASRRDIKPQTLRVIFKLAGLKVDEEYPG